MSEQLNLTTPIVTPTLAFYAIAAIVLQRDTQEVHIHLLGTNGEHLHHSYSGIVAIALIEELNTANMAIASLEKRILLRLVADGVLIGTISGSPN